MNKSLVSAAIELALFVKQEVNKSRKESYEEDRTKSRSAPADRFESEFGAGELCNMPGNEADHGERR